MSNCHINLFVVEEHGAHIIGLFNLHFRVCAYFTTFYEQVSVGMLAVTRYVCKAIICLFLCVCCDVSSGPGQALVRKCVLGETWPSEVWLF